MLTLLVAADSTAQRLQVGDVVTAEIRSPAPYVPGTGDRASWSYTVSRPGATFLKLHVALMALSAGDWIEVRDGEGRALGRLTDERRDFWIPAIRGDSVTLDLFAPSGLPGHGVEIDRYGVGFAQPFGPKIPCDEDNRRNIACVQGTPAFNNGQSVGRMLFEDGGSFFVCTGFLVDANNHLMSNEHCISSQANVDSLEVRFNYQQVDCAGTGLETFDTFQGDQFVMADSGRDVSLSTLSGDPASTYGFLELEGRKLVQNEPLYLVQHPGGRPKVLDDSADCRVYDPDVLFTSEFSHHCDTEGGSSGSPVFDDADKVIGLHHAGPLLPFCPPFDNLAIEMREILPLVCPSIDNPGCSGCEIDVTLDRTIVRPGEAVTLSLRLLHKQRFTGRARMELAIVDAQGRERSLLSKVHSFDYFEERLVDETFRLPERIRPGQYWVLFRISEMRQGTVERRLPLRIVAFEASR